MDYEKVLRDGKMDAFIASRWLKENPEVARKALQAYAEEQGANSVYELFPGRIPEGGEIDYNPGFFESALNATQNFLGNSLHSDLYPTYNPPRKIAPGAKPSLFDLEKMSGLDFGLEGSETPKDVFTDDEYLQERAKSKVYKPDYRSKDQKEAVKPAVTDPAPAPAPAQTLDNPNPKPSGTAAAAKAARKTSQDAFGEDDQQARIEKSEAIRRTQNEIAAQKKQDSMNASRAHQENVLAEMWEKYSPTGRADGRLWSELPENEKREMRKRYVEFYSPKQKQEAPASNNIIVPGQGEAGGFIPSRFMSETDMINAGVTGEAYDPTFGIAPGYNAANAGTQPIAPENQEPSVLDQLANQPKYRDLQPIIDGTVVPAQPGLPADMELNTSPRVPVLGMTQPGLPADMEMETSKEVGFMPAQTRDEARAEWDGRIADRAAQYQQARAENPVRKQWNQRETELTKQVNPFDLYGETPSKTAGSFEQNRGNSRNTPKPKSMADDSNFDRLMPVYGTENGKPKLIGYRNYGAALKNKDKPYNPFQYHRDGDRTFTKHDIEKQGGIRGAYLNNQLFETRQNDLSNQAQKKNLDRYIPDQQTDTPGADQGMKVLQSLPQEQRLSELNKFRKKRGLGPLEEGLGPSIDRVTGRLNRAQSLLDQLG